LHPHDARQLASDLLRRHGLPAAGWRFAFDHARRRFGSCRYGPKLITLSRPLTLLNSEDQVRDTLLHEIAHALCPGDGHGRRWKAKCREIGAKPARCYTEAAVVSPARRPAPYRLGCPPCGWWVDRRRITGRTYVCVKCRTRLVIQDKATGQPIRAAGAGRG
jgi:predicted SprT family Zn-dependent metalloprotease